MRMNALPEKRDNFHDWLAMYKENKKEALNSMAWLAQQIEYEKSLKETRVSIKYSTHWVPIILISFVFSNEE